MMTSQVAAAVGAVTDLGLALKVIEQFANLLPEATVLKVIADQVQPVSPPGPDVAADYAAALADAEAKVQK